MKSGLFKGKGGSQARVESPPVPSPLVSFKRPCRITKTSVHCGAQGFHLFVARQQLAAIDVLASGHGTFAALVDQATHVQAEGGLIVDLAEVCRTKRRVELQPLERLDQGFGVGGAGDGKSVVEGTGVW